MSIPPYIPPVFNLAAYVYSTYLTSPSEQQFVLVVAGLWLGEQGGREVERHLQSPRQPVVQVEAGRAQLDLTRL